LQKNEISKILGGTQANMVQCQDNKANDEKQNFTIKPVQKLINSSTKQVGDHKGRGIANEIDQEDLKLSHMPFTRANGQNVPVPYSAYKLNGPPSGHQGCLDKFKT
jgi:hypothetical protein